MASVDGKLGVERSAMPESQYLVKRRNTENLPRSFDPLRCRQNNHSHKMILQDDESCLCTKRRHTLAPGVSQRELFEKETKLIVLEFLKACTPRFKFDDKIEKTKTIPDRDDTEEDSKDLSNSEHFLKHMKVTKRTTKKQRKTSRNQSKTVTLGEMEHQKISEFQAKHRYQRSSSDLTSQQYQVMKRKFEEMQLPIIQWLQEHDTVVPDENENEEGENTLGIPKITTTNDEIERPPRIEYEVLLKQDTADCTSPSLRRPKNLTLNIPRRSIALQLVESNIFTPETLAVQRLEQISEEIIRDYGDVITSSMIDLLNPIQNKDSITYDIFSKVAKKVYNFATNSGGTLARLAMVLNLVKETMVKGNLNEEQLELLVDHSTKFFTENADESPLKEGKGWVELGLSATENGIFPIIQEQSQSEDDTLSNNDEGEPQQNEDNVWAPYGIAAFTVGIGLAYSCLKP